jgi:capsular exopolysaccharide synthesis family protein
MSKNFELMQQAGRDFSLEVFPGPAAKKRAAPADRGVLRVAGAKPLNFDTMAHEEALRLVQRVFLLQAEKAPRVVVFAGIDQGNGCSQLCVRVAETLATNVSGSVCLVEANFRSPSLPGLFGTTNHYGLTDSLLTEGPIRSFARVVRGTNLWLLSCGSLAPDSCNLLNSERIKTRFEELRKGFDYVVIDAPPLIRYADAIALGHLTDGFVLILEANSTRREAALKVTENLRAAQIPLLGAVLNKRTFPIPDSLYRRL